MDNDIIQLSLQLGQPPAAQLFLPTGGGEHLVFHYFEGRSFPDFKGLSGLCCYVSPAYGTPLLYISHSADLSRPKIPPRIRRLAKLLKYDLYITLTHYAIPDDEKGGWMDDPEEDIQRQWRHWLLLHLDLSNEILFRHPDCSRGDEWTWKWGHPDL